MRRLIRRQRVSSDKETLDDPRSAIRQWLLAGIVVVVAAGFFWTALTRLNPAALDAAGSKAAAQRMLTP